MCQNAALSDYSRKPSSVVINESEKMRMKVNWMRAALKVTAGYIPAADCVLSNQTTKDRQNHSLLFTEGLL